MDPFTLLAGATAIYNGIKSATDAGHEAIDVVERVGSLFARIAQITQLTSGNRKKKLFQSQAEYEAEAIKLYSTAKTVPVNVRHKLMPMINWSRAWSSSSLILIVLRLRKGFA